MRQSATFRGKRDFSAANKIGGQFMLRFPLPISTNYIIIILYIIYFLRWSVSHALIIWIIMYLEGFALKSWPPNMCYITHFVRISILAFLCFLLFCVIVVNLVFSFKLLKTNYDYSTFTSKTLFLLLCLLANITLWWKLWHPNPYIKKGLIT